MVLSGLYQMNRCVFFDRDGTVIEDFGYVFEKSKLELIPEAINAIVEFKRMGFLVIIVTNQSGVARGLYSMRQMSDFNNYLLEVLELRGIEVDALYSCPHHVEGVISEYSIECDCRKPKPGLLVSAITNHEIDPSQSYMIGDKDSDVKAGIEAKLKRAYKINSKLSWIEIMNSIIGDK